jgi:hypothetical protein
MEKKELAKMNRRIKALQKQLSQLGPVMRGSVVVIGTRNKQPYFSLNKNKKTHCVLSASVKNNIIFQGASVLWSLRW